jgi:signal transduction histidine kinase
VTTSATLDAASARAAVAHIQPHRALVARVIWLGAAMAVAGAFGAGLPGYVEHLTPVAYATWRTLLSVTVAIVFAAIGGLLVWRRPTDRMAVFTAFVLLLFGGISFPDTARFAVMAYPAVGLPYALLDLLGRAGFTLFVFVFPDGHFVPRWTRWVALVWIAVQAPVPFMSAAADGPTRAAVDLLTTPAFIIGLGTAAYSQVYRYGRVSTLAQQHQTRWTAFGFATALGLYLTGGIVQLTFPPAGEPLASLAMATLAAVAITLVPLSIGVALLWHRLYNLDALLGRTVVYGALSVCIVAVYMLVVGYLGSLFRTNDNLLISLVGTGAAAAVFHPLRQRLQRAANRLLYGQRDEPYAVLSDLGRRLGATGGPSVMLSAVVVETVARTLKLPYAAIRVEHAGRFADVASTGVPPGQALRLPLVHQGESMGELVLGGRGAGEPFGPADRRLLDDMARQAAAAVHAERLTADLQRSRQQLVSAREEERRRLRRDLHDGLGPTLAALGLKLETARNRLQHDPQAAALLTDLAERAQAAVADIRRMVYALRPPALDELGLLGALRQMASGVDAEAGNGLSVCVEASGPLAQLPAAVEVAAYRIAQEAVTNVVRHAEARACTITLDVADAGLRLMVEDDGNGLASDRRAGVGLESMRERAEELGGTLDLEQRTGGGTCVRAQLPLPTEART